MDQVHQFNKYLLSFCDVPGTMFVHKNTKVNMASLPLDYRNSHHYKLPMAAQSVMFSDVSVCRWRRRGTNSDGVATGSFLEEVTRKLWPERWERKTKQRGQRSVFRQWEKHSKGLDIGQDVTSSRNLKKVRSAESQRMRGRGCEGRWQDRRDLMGHVERIWTLFKRRVRGGGGRLQQKNSWIYTNSWNHTNNLTSEKPLPLNLVQTTALIQKWGKWEEWNEAKLMTALVKAALLLQSALRHVCRRLLGSTARTTDPPPPQQRKLAVRVSQIVGSGIKMPFPFWITEIIHFIVFTRIETYWLLLLIMPCYKALCICACVCVACFAWLCVDTKNCWAETQVQDSLPCHQSKALTAHPLSFLTSYLPLPLRRGRGTLKEKKATCIY